MLIYLLLISLLTRLVFLFFGHTSITHDEADFYLQGYLLAKTGSDIHGNNVFLSSGILTSISPIPVYLNALFFSFLPKLVISGRLPFAILNSFMPVIAYYIVSKLTKNTKLSFITFLVMNFSPWLSYLSPQAGYDSPLSFTFYLAAIATLLTDLKNRAKYLLFLLFSFLSFNSYMGIKVSFLPLVTVALIIKEIYENGSIKLKAIISSITLSLFITAALTILVYLAPGNQAFKFRAMDELLFFNKPKIEHAVWYERYVPTTPDWIKRIVSNKATVMADFFFDKYLKAFDPRMLFYRGDPHPLYGTYYFGLFYLYEIIFVVLGVFYAQKILGKKLIILVPFVMMLLVSPLPTGLSMITDVTIVFRAYPLIFPLSLFIAMGGYYFISALKKNFYLLSLVLYILAFSYFVFVFQTKIKYFSSEQWHHSQKTLSENIYNLKDKYKNIYVFTNEPRENALLYSYYQVKDAFLIKDSILKASSRNYTIGNVHFEERCPKTKLDKNNLYIIKRDVCDVRKNKGKSVEYKLTPYLEAYDHSGTVYWHLTNLEK